jgi:hypothetical protein
MLVIKNSPATTKITQGVVLGSCLGKAERNMLSTKLYYWVRRKDE